jgi:hypothetical protein
MRYITCVVVDEVNTPSEPLPKDARAIVFDGEKYVIYEDGDEIPSDI